mmetsp:Transcript_20243/g.23103  ORF Transcript_20243/g.23103 Transcript_20243/m.23103 type:complete len:555 (+) Transcript_20243:121-1785(+)|eukprot:CAMPEP_0194148996 /NCGR_PEP_ID=MMETSP0152-20130528/35812_1 /TAXON_ID=1049557 /ORGANISM="Thalassiothrix antarctica, Strain L6-D1" /LENGTH=554 /DNA_ID=CAMNT_0038850913 /DNA_START=184 /DNA_END=1851 /DNA_ORIENTATION=+
MATITLHVRLSNGTNFPILIKDDSLTGTTVLSVKKEIFEKEGDCPTERQRLIFKGRILEDDRTLSDYGIEDGSTIHLVKSRASTGSPATNNNVASTPSSGVTQQEQQQRQTNPFMMPSMAPDFSQMQQQMTPERMSQMMNSPLMQGLLDNPETMRAMMEMNPQMRQLMESNPQLREVMNNPQLLRQSMEMMRNPQAMQHMMRSQDLAMSQLENMPGGFAALSSMYRDVQEPMMEAMQSGNRDTSGSTGSANAANARSGAAGTAMPNPWGNPAQTSNQSSGTSTTAPSANPSSAPPLMNPWHMARNPFGDTATNNTANPFVPNSQQPSQQQMEQTLQMLENPAVNSMMDQFLASNPGFMEQIITQNPMIQQMRQNNPQAAAMMSNPEMLRTMMRPENIRTMMQGLPPTGSVPQSMGFSSGASGSVNPGGDNLDFSTLLNQMQSASLNRQAQPPMQQHPADRYRAQLISLRDMGFDDEQASLRALHANQGNLNRAVDMLLMGTVPDVVPGLDLSMNSNNTSENNVTNSGAATSSSTNADSETVPAEPKDAAEKKND